MRKLILAATAAVLGAVLGTPLAVIGAQAYQAVNGSAVTSTTTVRGGNGTAAAPTFSFSSDPDTGVFRSGANAIGFSTGGTERWLINSSGALNPIANNAYDLGVSGAAPRDITAARAVITPQLTLGATALTTMTGTGAIVLATSPTLVTPSLTDTATITGGGDDGRLNLGAAITFGSNNNPELKHSFRWRGRPEAGGLHTLTLYDELNATNRVVFSSGGAAVTGTVTASTPIGSASGGTGQNWGASSGIPLFTTGTGSLLASTGTGDVVRATSPTLVTPTLGAASATSINFGGTTLATYVEGVTAAVAVTCSTSGTVTLNSGYGKWHYTRIGRQVTATIAVNVASVSSPVGQIVVAGLPYASSNAGSPVDGMRWAGSIIVTGLTAGGVGPFQVRLDNNATSLSVTKLTSGSVANACEYLQASSEMYITITYFTS